MSKDPVPFKSDRQIFAAEDEKLAELKQNTTSVEDQLIATLMEPHVEDKDMFGLYFSFARAKAQTILRRFNVSFFTEETNPTHSE